VVRPLAGLVVLMLGLITGLVRAGHDERFGGHPLEMVMLLVWSGYFMSIITIAGLMCFEPWYRRRGERFDLAEEPASLWVCGQAMPVRIVNMSVTGALIRTPHPLVLPVDQPMHLQKRHIPVPLPCTLVHLSDTELAVVVYLYRAGNSVACKTGIMPPFHHHIRGQRDGITPLFLPAGAVGSALALLHVALCVAL
jgi:hypothetical protein